MWHGSFLLAMVLACGLMESQALAQVARQSSAKVETFVLAPAEKGLDLYVSRHGGHVAAVTQRGSRFAITYDGVAGPPLDEILGVPKQRVSFSPDSERYAYIGRSGQDYLVFVDGKELQRLPVATTRWQPAMSALPGSVSSLPQFTPNSKHVFFFVTSEKAGKVADLLFFDGQLVASPWPNARQLTLSPDGDHYAYVSASSAVNSTGYEKEYALLVDGRPAGYQGMEPEFTADGKHLFTKIRNANPASLTGQDIVVLLDGKPYLRAQDARIYVPPAGYGVVTVVTRASQTGPSTQFLVVDGKRLPGSDAERITRVAFSPDGKHWAAECALPQSKGQFMLIDGKKGPEYYPGFFGLTLSVARDSLPTPIPGEVDIPATLFSADSTRTTYIGTSGGKAFAVIDGEEYQTGYGGISSLTYGGRGKRVGFIGNGGNSRDRWIVVDGKATQNNFAHTDDFAFSPDGSRYAYTADGTGNDQRPSVSNMLVVDGVPEQGIVVSPMARAGRPDNDPIKFLFSPDGKHVVHYGYSSTDTRKRGLFIDGKHIPESSSVVLSNATFTPDGRHFLAFGQVGDASGRPIAILIYVDNRSATKVDVNVGNDTFMRQTPGAWDMGADGVLTAIAAVGENIVRIRITPPADASIDTMLASIGK
jgi:WD40 repeat protein